MTEIAWHGTVGLHEAKWTDIEGSTVTFKLPMNDELERQRNPFQKFTKRRKGSAGTRFMMICVEPKTKQAVYKDEVMLAGWNDSQSTGHTVKFWLCSDALGHPFEGFERKKDDFFISLAELSDDNEVIDQKVRERVERKGKSPSQRPSYGAVMLCKNPEFHKWISEDEEVKNFLRCSSGPTDWEKLAKEWICRSLGIESRGELDRSEEIRAKYHKKIYLPFSRTVGADF